MIAFASLITQHIARNCDRCVDDVVIAKYVFLNFSVLFYVFFHTISPFIY